MGILVVPSARSTSPNMSVAEAEVEKHASESGCWVIVGDEVYDVTKFLPDHPGGKKAFILFRVCGFGCLCLPGPVLLSLSPVPASLSSSLCVFSLVCFVCFYYV